MRLYINVVVWKLFETGCVVSSVEVGRTICGVVKKA